jgi:uncharacterized protein YndB with AHSA1/START domain
VDEARVAQALVGAEVDGPVPAFLPGGCSLGGSYRFEIGHKDSKPMAFFGKYVEVTPPSRLVWTNEESDDGAVTTLTFEEKDGKTLLTMREIYPSKEALDGAISGMEGGMSETFEQLDQLLVALVASAGRS